MSFYWCRMSGNTLTGLALTTSKAPVTDVTIIFSGCSEVLRIGSSSLAFGGGGSFHPRSPSTWP